MSKINKVKVCVRCRPTLPREPVAQSKRLLLNEDKVIIRMNDTKEFGFNRVFPPQANQEEIFDYCVKDLVDGCFEGYNATVFAYGQSGTGKTHTMGSAIDIYDIDAMHLDSNSNSRDFQSSIGSGSLLQSNNANTNYYSSYPHEGMIPRTVRYMFHIMHIKQKQHLSAHKRALVINMHVSFIEIYNEECKDLLHPDINARDIMIREDRDGKIFFTGAREEVVTTLSEVMEQLRRGVVNRTTGDTNLNVVSSRSHAIFSISLELFDCTDKEKRTDPDSRPESEASSTTKIISSKLHLVDLAGSERAKRTGATGSRLKESVGINQGLMALGKVIRALTPGAAAGGSKASLSVHIPYRESKLTRFLQDALGGNSRTVMIACISPCEVDLTETISTLQYAAKTKSIQNRVVANIVAAPPPVSDTLSIPSANPSNTGSGSNNPGVNHEHLELISRLTDQVSLLQSQLNSAQHQVNLNSTITSAKANTNTNASIFRQSIDANRNSSIGNMKQMEQQQEVQMKLIHYIYATIKSVVANMQYGMQELYPHVVDADIEESYDQLTELINENVFSTLQNKLLQNQYLLSVFDKTETITMPKQFQGYGLGQVGASVTASQVFHRSNLEEENAQLKEELLNCKEDLQRDEEIFHDKVKVLKACKKMNKQLIVDKSVLEERVSVLLEECDAVRDELDLLKSEKLQWEQERETLIADKREKMMVGVSIDATSISTGAGTGAKEHGDAVADDSPQESSIPESKAQSGGKQSSTSKHSKNRQNSSSNNHKSKSPYPETSISMDDLELSSVIEAAEPGTRELLEDLESLTHEKNQLSSEKREVERQCSQITSMANTQQQEFEQSKAEFQQKLKEMEVAIKLKQEVISSLTKAQADATEVAERNQRKATEFERNSRMLQNQLHRVEQNMKALECGEALLDDEKRKRMEYEALYAETKEKLEAMINVRRKREAELKETEARRRKDRNTADELQNELRALKLEYKSTCNTLEQEEQRHRKYLDALTAEVSKLKKEGISSQNRIKTLEKKNEELTSRLSRVHANHNHNGSGTGDSSVASGGTSTTKGPSKGTTTNGEMLPPCPYENASKKPMDRPVDVIRASAEWDDASAITYGTRATAHTQATHSSEDNAPQSQSSAIQTTNPVYASPSPSSNYSTYSSKLQSKTNKIGSKRDPSPTPRSIADSKNNTSHYSNHSSTTKGSNKTTANPPTYRELKDSEMKIYNWWLKHILQFTEKSMHNISKQNLKVQHEQLTSYLNEIKQEMKSIRNEKKRIEKSIHKQIIDIKAKIKGVQNTISAASATNKNSKNNKLLNRYYEHLQELQSRLHVESVGSNSNPDEMGSVAYTSEEQNRLDELTDEYECTLTEIELNETSQKELQIKSETERVSKEILIAILPSNITRDAVNKTNSESSSNTNKNADSIINKSELYQLQLNFFNRLNTTVSTDIRNKSDLDEYMNYVNIYIVKLMFNYIDIILKQVEMRKENEVLKANLESVETEKDELQNKLHSVRLESTRKMDQLKHEHDDKTSYLLQQLRLLEMQQLNSPMDVNIGLRSGLDSGLDGQEGQSMQSAYRIDKYGYNNEDPSGNNNSNANKGYMKYESPIADSDNHTGGHGAQHNHSTYGEDFYRRNEYKNEHGYGSKPFIQEEIRYASDEGDDGDVLEDSLASAAQHTRHESSRNMFSRPQNRQQNPRFDTYDSVNNPLDSTMTNISSPERSGKEEPKLHARADIPGRTGGRSITDMDLYELSRKMKNSS